MRVGAPNASYLPYALAPDPSGRLAAALGVLFRSGPEAPDSYGGLFGTVDGKAEARGGWGVPRRRRARRAAAIGAAIVAGVTAALLSRASRGANDIPETSRTETPGRRG